MLGMRQRTVPPSGGGGGITEWTFHKFSTVENSNTLKDAMPNVNGGVNLTVDELKPPTNRGQQHIPRQIQNAWYGI